MSCGLCCSGVLFAYVPVQPEEPADEYAQAGLVLEARPGGGHRMPLPCARFEDGKCQTYHCRPEPCKFYRCGLLRRHDADGISHAEALAVIEKVKAKRARLVGLLEKHLPDLAPMSLPKALLELDRQLEEMDAAQQKQFREQHGDLLIERATLELYLLRYFHVSEGVKNSTGKETMDFIMPQRD